MLRANEKTDYSCYKLKTSVFKINRFIIRAEIRNKAPDNFLVLSCGKES